VPINPAGAFSIASSASRDSFLPLGLTAAPCGDRIHLSWEGARHVYIPASGKGKRLFCRFNLNPPIPGNSPNSIGSLSEPAPNPWGDT